MRSWKPPASASTQGPIDPTSSPRYSSDRRATSSRSAGSAVSATRLGLRRLDGRREAGRCRARELGAEDLPPPDRALVDRVGVESRLRLRPVAGYEAVEGRVLLGGDLLERVIVGHAAVQEARDAEQEERRRSREPHGLEHLSHALRYRLDVIRAVVADEVLERI